MRMGKKIGLIVASYLVIGGLVELTQLGVSKLMAPPSCNGLAVYTLLGNFSRGIDVEQPNGKEKPESLTSYIFRFGRSLTLWLPDHLQQIISGDMTVRNYSMGGFRCVNYPFTSSSESLPPIEEPEITKHDVWGESNVSDDAKQK
jgi:hypothetical protein